MLSSEPRIRISGRAAGLAAMRFAAEVDLAVAAGCPRIAPQSFGLKLLILALASIKVPSTEKWIPDGSGLTIGSATIAVAKARLCHPPNTGSRFGVNTITFTVAHLLLTGRTRRTGCCRWVAALNRKSIATHYSKRPSGHSWPGNFCLLRWPGMILDFFFKILGCRRAWYSECTCTPECNAHGVVRWEAFLGLERTAIGTIPTIGPVD